MEQLLALLELEILHLLVQLKDLLVEMALQVVLHLLLAVEAVALVL
jgi:hypothetical protein